MHLLWEYQWSGKLPCTAFEERWIALEVGFDSLRRVERLERSVFIGGMEEDSMRCDSERHKQSLAEPVGVLDVQGCDIRRRSAAGADVGGGFIPSS